MDYIRIYLKKIAIEIQLTDYEQFGTDKVMVTDRTFRVSQRGVA